jgi:hypothetical protein
MIPSALGNKKENKNKQPGYVLLLSVIFLSVIAATIAGSFLLLGLAHGQTNFALQQAAQARGLAEACAETALNNLQQDPNYAGNETLAITADGSCNILPISFSDPVYTIQTKATVGPAIKNLLITAESQTATSSSSTLMHIDTWQEQ